MTGKTFTYVIIKGKKKCVNFLGSTTFLSVLLKSVIPSKTQILMSNKDPLQEFHTFLFRNVYGWNVSGFSLLGMMAVNGRFAVYRLHLIF